MPKCTQSVGGHETSTSAHVYIAPQPIRSLFVPCSRKSLHIGSRLKINNIHVIGVFPSLGFSFFVETLKSRIPNVTGSLCVFPCKVILHTDKEKSNPRVGITINPWFLPKLFCDNDRCEILGISRIKKREFGISHYKSHQTNKTQEEGFQSGHDLAGNLAFGFTIVIEEILPLAGIRIDFVFKCWPRKNGGKVKSISEKLDDSWYSSHSKVSTFLGGPGFLTKPDQITIV
mmetsp:Transcript_10820/g.20236  ORF Transcript_10820/g.20236 Transcript_10820/m.20236 type:complete len:230 (+) Transcript_10820:450-1139(+)